MRHHEVRQDMRAIRRVDGVIYVTMITRGSDDGTCLVKHEGRVHTVRATSLIRL